MHVIPLTPEIAVAPQIALADLAAAKEAGFTLVINNRPDHESAGQPTSAEMAAEAERLGLIYRHIPIVSGRFDEDAVAAFREALDEAPGPVLAFCRSGTRSTVLWGLASRGTRDAGDIIGIAAEAGYDLSPIRSRLE